MGPMTTTILLQAAPAALNLLGNLFNRRQQQTQQMPQMAPTITWDEAVKMAEAQLHPLAQQYDQQAMQRGFYGQMPNDLMRSDYLSSQQAAMANQMMQQDWQNKFNQQQAAADWSLKQGSLNLGQQQLNMQKGSALAGSYLNVADVLGTFPYTKDNTADFNQKVAAAVAKQLANIDTTGAANSDYNLQLYRKPYGA